jgi:hypothetical protein
MAGELVGQAAEVVLGAVEHVAVGALAGWEAGH